MKKLLAIILAAVLALSATACSQKTDNEEPVSGGEVLQSPVSDRDGQEEILRIDPLAYAQLPLSNKNGEGSIWQGGVFVYIPTKEGTKQMMFLLDIPENDGSLSNGDTVHIYMRESDQVEKTLRKLGIEFTRTEGDIVINDLNEYGQPGARDGKKATVNLNDYVVITCRGREGNAGIEFRIDYHQIVIDHLDSVSKNVAPEDMGDHTVARSAIHSLFKNECPYRLTSTSHQSDSFSHWTNVNGPSIANGDVVTMTWQIDEELQQKLSKLFNVEFVCEDIHYTVEGLQ